MKKLFCCIGLITFLVSCSDTAVTKETEAVDSPAILKKDTVVPKKDSILVPLDSVTTAITNQQAISEEFMQKATVSLDSSLWLVTNMRMDHRIFGYEKPDITSKKMILLSIFTDEVKDNPFKCPYGAYYSTSDMKDMQLKFISRAGDFIKVAILKNGTKETDVYMEKKWITFEK